MVAVTKRLKRHGKDFEKIILTRTCNTDKKIRVAMRRDWVFSLSSGNRECNKKSRKSCLPCKARNRLYF